MVCPGADADDQGRGAGGFHGQSWALTPGAVLYDVGAGTGSISIEASRQLAGGTVYAIERDPEALSLLEQNRARFGAEAVRLVPEAAPEAFAGLPAPTHAFVGGSGGRMEEILYGLREKNPQVRYRGKRGGAGNPGAAACVAGKKRRRGGSVRAAGVPGPGAGRCPPDGGDEPGLCGGFRRRRKGAGAVKETLTAAPRLLLAAAGSGCGKTAVACALIRAWQQEGLRLSVFKCGPDYIDPLFHRQALGAPCRNLDGFFMKPEEMRQLTARQAAGKGLTLIEGVMGYYDGLGGCTDQASAYGTAAATDTPAVLVLDGRGVGLLPG